MESPPIFKSIEDECSYWKEHAKSYHNKLSEVKQDYAEYIENSREIEAEMDATLDQKKIIIKDLKGRINLLMDENESLRNNNEYYSMEFFRVESQLENLKIDSNAMKETLRVLEQKNDNLERAERILQETIRDYELLLEKAYEKNALLETEVDEKEMLKGELQRLSDENKNYKRQSDRNSIAALTSVSNDSSGNINNNDNLNSATQIDAMNETANADNSLEDIATTSALDGGSEKPILDGGSEKPIRKLKMDPMTHPIQ